MIKKILTEVKNYHQLRLETSKKKQMEKVNKPL